MTAYHCPECSDYYCGFCYCLDNEDCALCVAFQQGIQYGIECEQERVTKFLANQSDWYYNKAIKQIRQ